MKDIIENIIATFKRNEEKINKAIEENNIDIDFDLGKIAKIIRKFETSTVIPQNQNLIFITNGNPYSTVILCMQALQSSSKIIISTQNRMMHLNKLLVSLFAINFQNKKPKYNPNISTDDLVEHIEKYPKNKIIIVDDKNKWFHLKAIEIPVKYCSMISIDLYFDSEEYNNMVDIIDTYCEKNYINLNIIKDEELTLNDIIEDSYDKNSSNVFIILTKDERKFETVKEEIKDKLIYMNHNPFNRYEVDIVNHIINQKIKL